jgi:RNA polymerase sigma factor (sigma-70 family)
VLGSGRSRQYRPEESRSLPVRSVRSLDAVLAADPEGEEQREQVVDPRPGPEQLATSKENWDQLVAGLTEREQEVVELVYRQDMTLAEAARELGLSASRVRDIHEQALARLRRQLAQPADAEQHTSPEAAQDQGDRAVV